MLLQFVSPAFWLENYVSTLIVLLGFHDDGLLSRPKIVSTAQVELDELQRWLMETPILENSGMLIKTIAIMRKTWEEAAYQLVQNISYQR